MARLIPTPPMGDMACCPESPMQSKPGQCQQRQAVDGDGQGSRMSSPVAQLVDLIVEERSDLDDGTSPEGLPSPSARTCS